MNPPTLLELRQASRVFAGAGAHPFRRGKAASLWAVREVDLTLHEGEVIGLVGESGSGKSTLAHLLTGSLALSGGARLWRGTDAQALPHEDKRAARLAVQMVHQAAGASLNPRQRVETLIGEAPVVHRLIARAQRRDAVLRLLARVGLDDALIDRYPYVLSGGQRSRVAIARALAVNPQVLVADEPIAALDVSVRAQILNLLLDLRESTALAMLLVSHDLTLVRLLADRVTVMYLGRIVESAPNAEFHRAAHHPYSQALLAEAGSAPGPHRYHAIKGDIASPWAPPTGCPFHPRCPRASARCTIEAPRLREIQSGHLSACHLDDTAS